MNNFDSSKLVKDYSYHTNGPIHSLDVDFINEASGIAASRNHIGWFYVHNDSGNPAELFIVDSIGHLKVRIKLEGIQNRDWEDIAIGPGPDSLKSYIYIGDIGDNTESRSNYFIYRLEEPIIPDSLSFPYEMKVTADRISFQYPLKESNNCEALMIDPITKDIYIATKSSVSCFYKLKYPYSLTSINTFELLLTIPVKKVTAGDISSDGTCLILKNYRRIFQWKRELGITIDSMLKSKPTELPYLIEQQGEGLCWSVNGKSYFTISELESGTKQFLIKYDKK